MQQEQLQGINFCINIKKMYILAKLYYFFLWSAFSSESPQTKTRVITNRLEQAGVKKKKKNRVNQSEL